MTAIAKVLVDVAPIPPLHDQANGRSAYVEYARGCLLRNAASSGTHAPYLADIVFSEARTRVGVSPHHDAVIGLLLMGSPPAVAGFVVAVVVNAVDREIGVRPGSHVGQEARETVSPPVANADPSSAVIIVLGGLGVLAALNHRLPCAVLWTVPALAGMSMGRLATKAPAGFGVAASEFVGNGYDLLAALAQTQPRHLPANLTGSPQDGETSERLATDIHGGPVAPVAPAGFRAPAAQVLPAMHGSLAAGTLAEPSGLTVCGAPPTREYRQPAGGVSGHIYDIAHADNVSNPLTSRKMVAA